MTEPHDATLFPQARILTPSGGRDAAALPWKAHPTFRGVFLKHLVTGTDTGGVLSCHLVRLEPGATLAMHTHDGQWELHEVAGGSGQAVIDGRNAAYRPGVVAVIPRGAPHAVTAGEAGLRLFAKFSPALV